MIRANDEPTTRTNASISGREKSAPISSNNSMVWTSAAVSPISPAGEPPIGRSPNAVANSISWSSVSTDRSTASSIVNRSPGSSRRSPTAAPSANVRFASTISSIVRP